MARREASRRRSRLTRSKKPGRVGDKLGNGELLQAAEAAGFDVLITVLNVMIASPSDVRQERQAAHALIHEWNAIHSQSRGQVLFAHAICKDTGRGFRHRPPRV